MEFCQFLRSVKFVVRSLGRFLGRGYSGVRVAAFFEKLAHFHAFVVNVGVVTASQSEKLR